MEQGDTANDWNEGNSPSPDERIGSLIAGKYLIVKRIGRGGFGKVYLAHNKELWDQQVAVKILSKEEAFDRFRLEAAIQAKLSHHNICGIQAYSEEDRAIVSPYIEGTDCRKLLDDNDAPPMAIEKVLDIARSLLDALEYAHANGVAHRDLKPSNIMIDERGHVFLIDFGIAKHSDSAQPPDVLTPKKARLTRTGQVPGTPGFVAPERLDGGIEYDPVLSDIYELAVTLCVLATKSEPECWRTSGPRWGKGYADRLPVRFRNVLQKASQWDPRQRYQSIREMADALFGPEPVARHSRRPLVWVAVIVVLVAVAGILYVKRDTVFSGLEQTTETPVDTISAVEPMPDTFSMETDGASASSQAVTDGSDAMEDIPARRDRIETPVETDPIEADRIDEEPAQQTSDRQPTPPPAAPTAKITVGVVPRSGTQLLVDQQVIEPFSSLTVDTGFHEIEITNPGYPIISHSMTIFSDTVLNFFLEDFFKTRPRFGIILGVSPPLRSKQLLVTLNGSENSFTSVPARIDDMIAGPWRMDFEIVDQDDPGVVSTKIDSVRLSPSPPGMSNPILGREAIVDFGEVDWQHQKKARVVVFWSNR